MKSVLTIAGSDSSGGAGIQADLKAFAAAGLYGSSVITCVTAQNTEGVRAIHPVPVDIVRSQMDAVLEDLDIAGAKTGMLYSAEIIKTVADRLKDIDFPLVVDPVMVATVGDSLASEDFASALREKLLPITTVVTPNIQEAEELSGVKIEDLKGAEVAAQEILSLGPKYVLIKGGHLKGPAIDLLYDGVEFKRFEGPRFEKDLHGSGCALSSFIAAYLGRGESVVESIRLAKRMIIFGYEGSLAPGKGVEVINPHVVDQRYSIWKEVTDAAETLVRNLPPELVPEVGINIGYALPQAISLKDVCGLKGRIVRVGQSARITGYADFGASKHIGRIILTSMRYDPRVRSAVNLKYSDKSVTAAEKAGLKMGHFERKDEPEGVSSMEWGTKVAIEGLGTVPDAIYDAGGPGKEAMIRILGENPKSVLKKVSRLVEALTT